MATAAVSAAATLVANLVVQEAKFLWGVEDLIKQLQTELQWMRSFLREADRKQAEDERVRTWVIEIRDLAYDVEDVIETFVLKIARKRKQGFVSVVKRATCILNEARLLHKVKTQIEEIIKRINESTRRLQTYGIKQLGDGQESSSSSRGRQREQRRSYPHLIQENVVGFDAKIEELVSVLVDRGEELRVVSIFGMGGIGKTTLAKKVYNHHQLRRHFDYFAWVYVSQQCEKQDVWAGILSSLDPTFDQRGVNLRPRDPQELAERLYRLLRDKRYLVVFDDVWSTQDWDDLKPGFPMEGRGSKVLVTTRHRDVALHVDPRVYAHELECLNDEDSWELFKRIVLLKRDPAEYVIDKKMEELGKEMVERCKGLPLAISVIGGILATKDCTYVEWKNVHDNVGSYFRKEKADTVHGSLCLSYEDLPSYLKPCFLYLAHFPEDYGIPVQELFQMWIAEGLICTTTDEDGVVEDIAESYLTEFLDRCIIQVGERHANLKVKTCSMHDLMRDFCLSKAKQESFLCVVDYSHDNQDDENNLQTFPSLKYSARKLAIHRPGVIMHIKNPHLRTLLLFKPLIFDLFKELEEFDEDSRKKGLKSLFETREEGSLGFFDSIVGVCLIKVAMRRSFSHILDSFGKLRVLFLNGQNILLFNELKEVDSLIHLRYLCLTGATISKLPSSLGKLSCLVTLNLRYNSGLTSIPDVISKMEQLRHLYFPENFICKTKLRLGNLRNLQTLVNFSTTHCQVEDLGVLIKLKELSMRGFAGYRDNSERCFAENCCDWMKGVLKTGDDYTGPKEDPMPMLEKLPNLRILVIEAGAFMVEEMICSARGFFQLESLTLDGLYELVDLKIAEGGMTGLYHLNIKNCQNLKMLPTGFKSVTTLKKVDIEEMPRDFENWFEE